MTLLAKPVLPEAQQVRADMHHPHQQIAFCVRAEVPCASKQTEADDVKLPAHRRAAL